MTQLRNFRVRHLFIVVSLVATWLAHQPISCVADTLMVEVDFEGASVCVLEIDEPTRSVSFMPGGDSVRGWPCWWYFRLDGITPGETITLRLRGSTAAVEKQKPLSAVWAMPIHATYSMDGETWLHTEKGQLQESCANQSDQANDPDEQQTQADRSQLSSAVATDQCQLGQHER